MGYATITTGIGQGWVIVFADREPDEIHCIEVRCTPCGGVCYTTEGHYGRARLYSHVDCIMESHIRIDYLLNERGIAAHYFSRRN